MLTLKDYVGGEIDKSERTEPVKPVVGLLTLVYGSSLIRICLTEKSN